MAVWIAIACTLLGPAALVAIAFAHLKFGPGFGIVFSGAYLLFMGVTWLAHRRRQRRSVQAR